MTSDRVRDEAERLVAAAIAAVSLAARGMGAAGRAGSGFATGSPECCACPVCRVISAMRDPSADIAERLASGAGDLAIGVASMLRALSRSGGHPDATGVGNREGDEFWESLRRRAAEEAKARAAQPRAGARGEAGWSDVDADPWRAATSTAPPAKPMAKKVAKKAVKKAAPASPGDSSATVATDAPADPAPASMAPASMAPAKKAVAKKAVAKKAVAKKATAKKAVPPPEEFG